MHSSTRMSNFLAVPRHRVTEMNNEPISFNVGGWWFQTSRETLEAARYSNLAHVRDGTFVDRDPTYFRYILNALRGTIVLPNDAQSLYELRFEADYFNLESVVNAIDLKLKTHQSLVDVLRRLDHSVKNSTR